MQILFAQFSRLPPFFFKFHSTSREVSKVPATGGGGGVVRTDRPTSLFFRAHRCRPHHAHHYAHTCSLCPPLALCVPCVLSMTAHSPTPSHRIGQPHTRPPIRLNEPPTPQLCSVFSLSRATRLVFPSHPCLAYLNA